MISKTKLKSRLTRKTNPSLVETLNLALKNPAWNPIAKILSSSTRAFSSINLNEIESKSEAGDTIIIIGKVLSTGDLKKQVTIAALSISQAAKAKLQESKSKFITIAEEIKSNPKAEGLKILK
ncbi:50S ribosomal protein L18e [Candidatus Pacearchaeota archaeon]|nr:50S ribosomal protein L18e [Candidatus Pacearchaeota archaeon]|tara:strand:- start:2271 stop:2639 length:369 start_codon:yes stop_codon:yes gene_type:complete